MTLGPINPRIKISAALFGLSLLASACGPEQNNGTTPPPPPVDTNSSENNKNTENSVMEPDMPAETDMPGENNTGNQNSNTGNQNSNTGNNSTPDLCNNVEDLGTIDVASGELVLEGDTTPAAVLSLYATECGFGSAAEVGFQVRFDQPAELTATTDSTGLAWAIELREGKCEMSTKRFCTTQTVPTFTVEADKDYILMFEPRMNSRGTFKSTLKINPLVCLPIGARTCAGDDLEVCTGGGQSKESITCGAPCSMDACGGDICANAIEVSSFPHRFTAVAEAYEDTINFGMGNSCTNPDTEIIPNDPNDPDGTPGNPTPEEPTGDIPTPGQDVIFKLTGLTAGKKLTVDASSAAGDEADSSIFVLDGCDTMQCRIGVDLGDKLTEWEVPADGDYYVIVDRTSRNNTDFAVDIDLTD